MFLIQYYIVVILCFLYNQFAKILIIDEITDV